MKSLQEYRTIYRNIAQNLGYRGDSVELLVHLLANATYIEEVENISYALESSLEKAHLDNSKIQHCMDLMYSVYRGSCPKVYIKIKAGKLKTLTPYSEIATSSNFSVYFLGYYNDWDEETGKEKGSKVNGFLDGFELVTDSLNIVPGETYILCGFISKKPYYQVSTINYTNTYYIDLGESNLSNDMYIQVAKQGVDGDVSNYKVTTNFKDYLLNFDRGNFMFDLTTTDYGSRLYFKDSQNIEPNDVIMATYFPYVSLSSFLPSELGKISVSFGELLEFNSKFKDRAEAEYKNMKGLIITKESAREDLGSIHYEANKSRYQNSIIRSNEDLGALLRQFYPDEVYDAECKFENDSVVIYYIPKEGQRLTSKQQNEFISSRLAYYISGDINIYPSMSRPINLDISLSLSSLSPDLEEDIENIVSEYERSYKETENIMKDPDDVINRISSAISKLSGVNYVKNIEFLGLPEEEVYDLEYYFEINCIINSSIS